MTNEQINTPARYVTDSGDVVYRASALGYCDRMFVALANGYDPMAHPEWFQEVLDEGTRMEDAIRFKYEQQYPNPVENIGHTLTMEVLDGVYVMGHIDGTHEGHLWEAKKFRDSTWQKFLRQGVEVYPHYPMQTAFYMHALQEEDGGNPEIGMMFVGGRYNPTDDKIEEIDVKWYPNPPVPLLGIKKRVAKLEALINGETHPMDVKCVEPAMYPCPMYYLHDPEDAYEPPERPSDEIIAPLIKERMDLNDRQREARAIFNPDSVETKARIKAINDGIAAWCEASGVPDGDVVSVAVDDTTYDIKSAGVFRKGYVVNDTTYTKVTIKPRGEDGKPVVKKTAKKMAARKKG